MANLKRKLIESGLVTFISLFSPKQINAQLPFFVGKGSPQNYAIENRILLEKESPNFKNIFIAKTFREEIPVWGYIGNSYVAGKSFGKPFYGIGARLKLKDKLYMAPTIEGSGKQFDGVTLYSTLIFGKNWNVDLSPRIDKEFNPTLSFNAGKTYNGWTFGLSSCFKEWKFEELKNLYFRLAKIKNGNFIDIGINPNNKSVRVSFQKAFGIKRGRKK